MRDCIQDRWENSQPTDVVAVKKICRNLTEGVQHGNLISANSVANVSPHQANWRDMPQHTPKIRFLSAKPVGSVFATQVISCNTSKYIQKPSWENARSAILSNLNQNRQTKIPISAKYVSKVSHLDGN